MDKIKPERNESIHYVEQKTRPEFVIAIGLILAALISVGGWIGYIEYKEYRAEKDLEAWTRKAKADLVEADRQARLRMQQVQERLKREQTARMLNSERGIATLRDKQLGKMEEQKRAENCRYWTSENREHSTQGTRSMVQTYCG